LKPYSLFASKKCLKLLNAGKSVALDIGTREYFFKSLFYLTIIKAVLCDFGEFMRAQNLFDAKPIVFDSILRLGASGQTDVYALIQDPSLAAKVVERPSVGMARKLAFMVGNPPAILSDEDRSFSIAWPVDLLLRAVENGTNVGGFVMRRASNSFSIVESYTAEARRNLFPAFTYRSMHKIARNLASAYNSLRPICRLR
jgi:DNA-binding helix-hairpin-helix protein with protein kinase domain